MNELPRYFQDVVPCVCYSSMSLIDKTKVRKKTTVEDRRETLESNQIKWGSMNIYGM